MKLIPWDYSTWKVSAEPKQSTPVILTPSVEVLVDHPSELADKIESTPLL